MFIYVHDSSYHHDSIHIAVRDTVNTGLSSFVGYNPNPAAYTFGHFAHIGTNQVIAYVDSARPRPDSSNWRRLGTLQFDSTKFYNIYLQNYFYPKAGQDTLQLKTVRLN